MNNFPDCDDNVDDVMISSLGPPPTKRHCHGLKNNVDEENKDFGAPMDASTSEDVDQPKLDHPHHGSHTLNIDSDDDSDLSSNRDDHHSFGRDLRRKYEALTEEQQFFCDLLIGSQCNLFLTGVPGSGKTHTLRVARDMLLEHAAKRLMESKKIAVTDQKLIHHIHSIAEQYPICAPTAMAASHIPGATTMHSALSLPIRLEGPMPTKSQLSLKALDKYRRIEVLFIDEISMVHPTLFAYMIHVIRVARGDGTMSKHASSPSIDTLPRIVLMGDFHQLPPVDKRSWQEQRQSPLPKLFELDLWNQLKFKTVYLERSIRQDTDGEFFAMNMAIREGLINDQVMDYLRRKQRDYRDTWVLVDKERQLYNKPTRLCTTNAKVDAENESELMALKQSIVSFKGAMIITKDDYTTVNTKCYDLSMSGYNLVSLDAYDIWHDEVLAIDSTMQAKLSSNKMRWPIKSRLAIGAQVVLTVNLESILLGSSALINGSKGVVTGFDGVYPKVHFANGRKLVIRPWLSEVEHNPQPSKPALNRVDKDRTKIFTFSLPLRLAWAETIHSAQGSTLSMAHIQTTGSMQPGQFYVASSRCKSGADVSWDKFDTRCIVVDQRVKEFYAKLKQDKAMHQLYE